MHMLASGGLAVQNDTAASLQLGIGGRNYRLSEVRKKRQYKTTTYAHSIQTDTHTLRL